MLSRLFDLLVLGLILSACFYVGYWFGLHHVH